jgi:acetyl-CoA carboxylase biotin carboxylase subunit
LFKKILIANRGEIALRVLNACRELGIETVMVYSTADAESLPVIYADEEVCIGPPSSSLSYLNMTAILAAAEITGADAIHPGYGFLAENAHFAEVVEECKVTWIGPRPETIRLMGDKAAARATALRAGVPVLPGSDGALADSDAAVACAKEVGYPVILKAAAGGGGKGMRIVHDEEHIASQFEAAENEAQAAFGDGTIYLEKYLPEPRHIEFQIFGDSHGRVVHLGERECSIQRRHQKLIEESPAPGLTDDLRAEMAQAAIKLGEEVGYVNAGTIEFLVDPQGNFYFMEMNTRIQVEHPVTEMITGLDLVKMQLEVAAGGKLDVATNLKARGHAIECRINAEHPETFMPCPGKIQTFHPPGGPGVRIDTHAYEHYFFPPYYDSLIAKLLAWGRTREEAVARMSRALDQFVIEGITTTVPLHAKLMKHPDFRAGRLSTRFLERYFASLEQAKLEGASPTVEPQS